VAEEVRPTRKVKVRREPEVVTLEEMTEHQWAMIEASNQSGETMPPGTEAEQLAWIHRKLGGRS